MMKRCFIVLLLLLMMVRHISSAPEDVPSGHWAYEAVQTLSDMGILASYPDGTFRGRQPMTRYEFAQALREAIREMGRRIAQIQIPQPPAPQPAPSPIIGEVFTADMREKLNRLPDNLEERLRELEKQHDILRRMIEEFQRDLDLLGEDVQQLKYELTTWEGQVRSLEQRLRARAQVNGSVDFITYAGQGIDRKGAIDLNGYTFRGGLLNNLQIAHELSLHIRADTPHAVRTEATFLVSNYLTTLGSASHFVGGTTRAPGVTDFVLWKADVRLPVHLFGRQGSLSLGRIENRMTPLTLWRPDTDVYVQLPRYDNGFYTMDGVKFQMDTDLLSLMLYAARHNAIHSNTLLDIMRVSAGNDVVNLFQPGNPVRQRPNRIPYGILHARDGYGGSAQVRMGHTFSVGGQFLSLGVPTAILTTFGPANRANIWGWQADWRPSEQWALSTIYAQSDLLEGTQNRLNKDNWAFLARAQYEQKSSLIWVGYRDFRPYFSPPGYWGRIGYWHNPTDLQGVDVGLGWRSPRFLLSARGGFYAGTGKAVGVAGFGSDDSVNHLLVGMQWNAQPNWQLSLTYEGVYWNLKDAVRFNPGAGLSAPGKPVEHYATFGIRYDINKDTVLRALYQLIAYDAKGVASYSLLGSDKERGGLAVVQLSTGF